MAPFDINLAAGRKCSAFSSLETQSHALERLTDGEREAAGWSSKAFVDYADHRLYPEYVVVDLGRNCTLDRVELYPDFSRTAGGFGFPVDFTIQICREGEAWQVVSDNRGYPLPEAGKAQVFRFQSRPGRYLKVEATWLRSDTAGQHRFQLSEIEVYGKEKEVDPLAIEESVAFGATAVCGLRCEHAVNPMGVNVDFPRLEWNLNAARRAVKQSAYRILVADSRESLAADCGTLWDSGRVDGDQTIAIRYAGLPLKSGQRCLWKVMAWDQDGAATAWSETAQFVVGKLSPVDWKGQWIGAGEAAVAAGLPAAKLARKGDLARPAICLRKEIVIGKPVKRATAFFCGLGFSELSINGAKVGDGVMTPGFTTYEKRVQYMVHDVTEPLAEPGIKTLGVILVDGWYGLSQDPWVHMFEGKPYVDQPKMILDLHLEFIDGSEVTIISDPTWKWSHGEITRSWLCEEDIDLRQARRGWDREGFDDRLWRPSVALKSPAGQLVCQAETPTRVTAVIKPQTLVTANGGKAWVYDFGREFTGALRFRASGPAGRQIKLTVCSPAGSESCEPRVNIFTLAGQDIEEYVPRFCYNAISRVQVEGLSGTPALDDLSAVELAGVGAVSGGFRCSNDLLNWLHESARRTHKAYVTYLPNDPTREFKAWAQDIQNMFCSAAYLYDSRVMYERWQHDLVDCQRADGNSANVAPGPVYDFCNSPWWGGCLVWLPWHWYLQYGDPSLLVESYEPMKQYVDYLGRVSAEPLPDWGLHNIASTVSTSASSGDQDPIIQDWGLRDWICIEHTPTGLVNTPAYYLYARIVSRTADMLGRRDEATRYARLAGIVREAYNLKFLDPTSGIYGISGSQPSMERWWDPTRPADTHEIWWSGDRPCTQAGQALPLALDLVPTEVRSKAEAALIREVEAHRRHVSSGFVATPYLLEMLADIAPELGYAMTTAQDYPSWYSMTAGSAGLSDTVLVDHDLMQEGWNGRPALMPSLGGNIAGWNMQALGGIRPDPTGPGFDKIIIKPNVVGDLHWVESGYDSVHGRIVSTWRRRGAQLVLDVTIPANTSATVYVPAERAGLVKEGQVEAGQAEGVKFLRMESGRAVFEVNSGRYQFSSQM